MRSSRGFTRLRSELRRGFTLIELLLVIGIIGILASVVIVAINPAKQLAQARNGARRKDVAEIVRAVQQHVIGKGSMPAGVDATLRMIGTASSGCSVLCSQGGIPVTPVTFSTRISAGSNDVEEVSSTGEMRMTSSDLELAIDTTPWNLTDLVGIRFPNVTVPAGSTVISAAITFRINEVTGGPASLTIHAEAADDATAFNTNAFDLSSRARTAAVVAWSPPDWTVENAYEDTPDVASLVQEVVGRAGWVSGNDLVFVIGGTGTRTAFAYEGNANDSAPLLTVTYAPGTDISAGTCLNLNTLSGTYVAAIPKDPSLGTAGKSYYAVKKTGLNRIYVQSCGAELSEKIVGEQ